MRFRITPQNASFYEYFADLAGHVLDGAYAMRDILGLPQGERAAASERIKEIEHLGDEATHTVMNEANSSFITPFDRSDIYALASRLDDCLDHLEAAVDIVVLYGIDDLPQGVDDQVDILVRMAELTSEAMPHLRLMRNLQDYWIEINRLENAADQRYRQMTAALFREQQDAVQIIKLKAVIDELEAAADSFETVANTVESIAVKES